MSAVVAKRAVVDVSRGRWRLLTLFLSLFFSLSLSLSIPFSLLFLGADGGGDRGVPVSEWLRWETLCRRWQSRAVASCHSLSLSFRLLSQVSLSL